ncbi:hypothetical protein IEQ34_015466 [Dendrobium chrysotoxum]|uniref:Uncharacterized protein n=1 Tax=Dendrobium chrysotoxum TaxID=161865 RepID=A0AAV7GII9_DENCH|nr:hypothetical protein IEQ34_015466 [Dendrobium chrysotoxum]
MPGQTGSLHLLKRAKVAELATKNVEAKRAAKNGTMPWRSLKFEAMACCCCCSLSPGCTAKEMG